MNTLALISFIVLRARIFDSKCIYLRVCDIHDPKIETSSSKVNQLIMIKVVNSSDINLLIRERQDGIILSALNLFMLGFLKTHPWFCDRSLFWCDGLMGLFFARTKGVVVKQLRGVDLLKHAFSSLGGSSICILGSIPVSTKNLLNTNGICLAEHYNLENVDVINFTSEKIILSERNVFLTLPSPKQEIIASKLASDPRYSKYNFYCVGGALAMLANPDLDCPKFLQKLGLEFLFRLRTDTWRRLTRLMTSAFLTATNSGWLARQIVAPVNLEIGSPQKNQPCDASK